MSFGETFKIYFFGSGWWRIVDFVLVVGNHGQVSRLNFQYHPRDFGM